MRIKEYIVGGALGGVFFTIVVIIAVIILFLLAKWYLTTIDLKSLLLDILL
jgi:hypothetical protein